MPATTWAQFHLPRLRWRPEKRQPLIKADLCKSCPELSADLTLVDQELLPRFYELDEAALRAQNSFRLVQLVIIVGGTVAACLGIVQTALGGGVLGVALAEALVAGLLAGITMYTRSRSLQREYLSARLEAERLRGEYFRYLGRVEPYDSKNEEERLEQLRQQVATREVST